MDIVAASPHALTRTEIFEDRYGAGALQRLLTLFAQPCLSFAEIGERFGVTRERVRQWHRELLPDAPRGHARQRLCWLQQEKRRLLTDPLFRAFYRHARAHFAANRFVLVRGRDRFHKREVRLDGKLIALREARPAAKDGEERQAWLLRNTSVRADFIYYRLDERSFYVIPRGELPGAGLLVRDGASSPYYGYRNSFSAALVGEVRQAS